MFECSVANEDKFVMHLFVTRFKLTNPFVVSAYMLQTYIAFKK